MMAGKVIDVFEVEGQEVIIRYPEMKDLEDILEYINSVIEEGKYLNLQEKQSREEELDWLTDVLKDNEKENKVHLVVEVDGKVMGGASVETQIGAKSHVGEFGIALHKDIREMGIGTRLAEATFPEARKRLDVEIVKFGVFEKNKRAKNFYKKLGFEEKGRIDDGVCIDGECQDSVIMQKELE